MAISLQNLAGTNVLEVDGAFKAARVSLRPLEALGWNSVGAKSSGLTSIAAAAPLFSFRNMSANPILVRRAGVGFITTTAFTAPQAVDFGLQVARAFTVSDTGGTPIALTGNNGKHRTSLATSSSIDCRIAASAALVAGSKTLDANHLGMVAGYSAGVGVTITPAPDNLFQHDAGDYPLVLAQNEGFNITNLTAIATGGGGLLFVNFEFAEAASY